MWVQFSFVRRTIALGVGALVPLVAASCGDGSNGSGNGPGIGAGTGLPSGNQPGGAGSVAQFSPDDALKICVSLAACLPEDFDLAWGGDVNDCLNGDGVLYLPNPGNYTQPQLFANALDGPLVDFFKCAKRAGSDCDALGRCLSLDGNGGRCSTPSGLADGSCEGTILSGCSADGYRFQADCARYGTTCGESHLAFATFQACVWPPCSAEMDLKCDGTAAKACTPSGGEATVLDCGLVGTDCLVKTDTDGSKHVRCSSAQPSPSCQEDPNNPGEYLSAGTCDGTKATYCQSDGALAVADCSELPYRKRCLEGKCTTTGTECEDSSATTCDGATVVACHDGFVRKVDCTALGFGGCAQGKCYRQGAPPGADAGAGGDAG